MNLLVNASGEAASAALSGGLEESYTDVAIGRMAGDGYARTRDQFEMIRPDPNYKGR